MYYPASSYVSLKLFQASSSGGWQQSINQSIGAGTADEMIAWRKSKSKSYPAAFSARRVPSSGLGSAAYCSDTALSNPYCSTLLKTACDRLRGWEVACRSQAHNTRMAGARRNWMVGWERKGRELAMIIMSPIPAPSFRSRPRLLADSRSAVPSLLSS